MTSWRSTTASPRTECASSAFWSLKSAYGDYTDICGLWNSHDRKFPVGISFGSRVFVCDNLAFVAEHVIRRKHTVNAKRDLPGLVSRFVEPLAGQRREQHEKIELYKFTSLTDQTADHAITEMYRQGVINVQRIATVEHEWQEPRFEEFADNRNAWRLFNAATYALSGKVNDYDTPQLHRVIESVC